MTQSTDTAMTGAQAVVEILVAYGVEVIFGVPGDTSLPLYDALYKASPKIRHILARDERSAVFMADTYARLTHRPAVCECPSGAGALYSIPGIAEANASSIPIILLTSDVSLAGEGKGTITELDHHTLFEPVTKWSTFLKHADKVPETMRKAFRVATTHRPGAVHLAFPTEVMAGHMTRGHEMIYAETECASYPAYRTRGNSEGIKELADTLVSALKPVMIIGGGAMHSQAGELIIDIAEGLSIPVVTTISGQGIMPDDHPLALGVIGDNGFHPHAHMAIDQGDTLVYIGCKMGSVSTIKWTRPAWNTKAKIIQVDIDPTMLANNYHNHLSVAGDAALVLNDVRELLIEMSGKSGMNDQIEKNDQIEIPSERTAWVTQLNLERHAFWEENRAVLTSESLPIKPQRVIHAVNERLIEPSVVIADAGTPTPHITRFLRLKGKGSRFIIPRSFGGLGYAIPAVVGAHLANPHARIVGMFGDGSLGMSAGELETLARMNVPVVLIHFNNGTFGWIKALQSIHSGGRFMSVDFTQGNMAAVAQAFGILSFHVNRPDELDTALDKAFNHDGPVFIDVVAESEVTELPPVYSWQQASKSAKQVST